MDVLKYKIKGKRIGHRWMRVSTVILNSLLKLFIN